MRVCVVLWLIFEASLPLIKSHDHWSNAETVKTTSESGLRHQSQWDSAVLLSCDARLRDKSTFITYILVDQTVESVFHLLQFPPLSLKQHAVKSRPQVSACKSDAYFTYLPREAFRGAVITLQGIVEGCFYWQMLTIKWIIVYNNYLSPQMRLNMQRVVSRKETPSIYNNNITNVLQQKQPKGYL